MSLDIKGLPSAQSKRGFTLVELLVVIAIIGTLVALLLPAVQAARETARGNTCRNNIKQYSFALINYDTTQRSLPGYINKLALPSGAANQGRRASWVVMTFPYTENSQLWDRWSKVLPGTANYASADWDGLAANDAPQQEIAMCPSDPPEGEGLPFLSYVVNAGQAWEDSTRADALEHLANGIFTDRFRDGAADILPSAGAKDPLDGPPESPLLKCSINYVQANDGTSKTLMMSENLHATFWCYDGLDVATTQDAKHHFGFVWHNAVSSGAETRRINGDNNTYIPNTSGMNESHGYPSSPHPSSVNVAYCDGHVTTMSENVEGRVYAQLMTSNYKRSKYYNGSTPDRDLPQPSDDEY